MLLEILQMMLSSARDLTAAHILKFLSRFSIKPESIHIERNFNTGESIMSSMAKVSFNTNNKDQAAVNLIVKLLPQDPQLRLFVLQYHMDEIEIRAYQELLPHFILEIPKLRKYISDVVFSRFEEADESGTPTSFNTSILVLQDWSAVGYSITEFHQIMNPLNYKKGLKFSALLHAASINREDTLGKSILEMYPWIRNDLLTSGNPRCIDTRFRAALPLLKTLFADQSERLNLRIIEVIERKSSVILVKLLAKGQEHAVALHGDFLQQNILHHCDDAQAIKIIDWQAVRYGDPTFELAYYICNSLPIKELSRDSIMDSAHVYYKSFAKHCSKKAKGSFSEFKETLLTIGISYAFVKFTTSLSFHSKRPHYMQKFQQILEILAKLGAVDFMLSLI